MTIIACDIIISKETSQLLLTMPISIYKVDVKMILQCSFRMLDGQVNYLK